MFRNPHIRLSLITLSLIASAACQASGPVVVEVDPVQREALLGAVRALEGSWALGEGEHAGVIEFQLTSNGSVVRELMFPGDEHEMTNMYSLDGNSLVMTHYCSVGNQPRMRATAVEGNRIVFESDGVGDLKAADEHYMGAMTLVLVDDDTIEQHWVSFNSADDSTHTPFKLKRMR